MIVKTAESVAAKPVEMEGAEGVRIRLLVHEADGAPNFYMRQFDIAPGGCTPRHQHPWEHEVYILEGQGVVFTANGDRPIRAGDCVFVPGGEVHQFRGAGQTPLKFLCLVPRDSK